VRVPGAENAKSMRLELSSATLFSGRGGKSMSFLPFPWIFVGLAAVVDMVGLFYLWRRRNVALGTNHRPAPRMRIPLADRRLRNRRRSEQAATA